MLTSERLRIRPLTDEDLEDLLYLDSDPVVMKYINGGKVSTRQDYEDIYLPRQRSYSNHAQGWGLWHCALHDGTFIGWLLSRPMNFFNDNRDDSDIEIGWRFVRSAWGQGYATEGAKALMAHLETITGVERLTMLVDPENSASINVGRKLGMTYLTKQLHKDPLGDAVVCYYSRQL